MNTIEQIIDNICAYAGLACGNKRNELEAYLKFCKEMNKLQKKLYKKKLISSCPEGESELAANFVRSQIKD